MTKRAPKAIGIVRVSVVGDREDEDRFVSPDVQSDRIRDLCEREGLRLVDIFKEPNVSGGAPLERRPGLSRAVASVEAGRADVIVFAYFDRFVRSLEVQAEVVRRITAARGRLLAADTGWISEGTVTAWANGTLNGFFAEFYRRSIRERSMAGQAKAIEKGHAPVILVPGLRRGDDGQVELDPELAPAVAEAVQMRARAATVASIREHLAAHGVRRSYHGTTALLGNRQLVGEIKFGDRRMPVPPIVDRATWDRAQAVSVPRGPRAKSERLLSRAGVLRCSNCNGRMVVATANRSDYYVYRCPPTGDCPRRVSISADAIEELVVASFFGYVANLRTERLAPDLGQYQRALERAQAERDALVAILDPLEPADRDRLEAASAKRDRARADLEEARERLGLADIPTVRTLAERWDEFDLAEKRRLLGATFEAVLVHPAKDRAHRPVDERVTIRMRGSAHLGEPFERLDDGRARVDFDVAKAIYDRVRESVGREAERALRT